MQQNHLNLFYFLFHHYPAYLQAAVLDGQNAFDGYAVHLGSAAVHGQAAVQGGGQAAFYVEGVIITTVQVKRGAKSKSAIKLTAIGPDILSN